MHKRKVCVFLAISSISPIICVYFVSQQVRANSRDVYNAHTRHAGMRYIATETLLLPCCSLWSIQVCSTSLACPKRSRGANWYSQSIDPYVFKTRSQADTCGEYEYLSASCKHSTPSALSADSGLLLGRIGYTKATFIIHDDAQSYGVIPSSKNDKHGSSHSVAHVVCCLNSSRDPIEPLCILGDISTRTKYDLNIWSPLCSLNLWC